MGLRWMRALVFEEAAPDVSRTQVAQVPVSALDPGQVLGPALDGHPFPPGAAILATTTP